MAAEAGRGMASSFIPDGAVWRKNGQWRSGPVAPPADECDPLGDARASEVEPLTPGSADVPLDRCLFEDGKVYELCGSLTTGLILAGYSTSVFPIYKPSEARNV